MKKSPLWRFFFCKTRIIYTMIQTMFKRIFKPKEKLYIYVVGGLGNRMFQYATGYSYAKKHNKKLFIDDIDINKSHIKLVDTFNIKHREEKCVAPQKTFSENMGIFLRDYMDFDGFDSLLGYFQDSSLFNQHRRKLLKFFTIKNKQTCPENIQHAKLIKKCNSVSIHIRRTDYLTAFPNSILDEYYYNQAISYITSRLKEPHFFIFSDDIDWVCKHIHFKTPHTFITCNQSPESAVWDMHLMSLCKHNIIANSSFSWWGAWLNNNRNKIIVSPSTWIIDEPKNINAAKYIIPDDWVKLSTHN